MNDERGSMDRRDFLGAVGIGSAGLALAACHAVPGPHHPTTGPGAAGGAASGGAASGGSGGPHPLEAFGVSEADARKVMSRALCNGGDFCDLFFQDQRVNNLGLEDHAVNRASATVDRGLGVRVVRGVETGYAFTESLDLPSMMQAAEVAAAVASGAGRDAPAAFKVGRGPDFYPVQQPWARVSTEKKVALLMQLEAMTLKRDRRITKVNITYRDEEGSVVVMDSEGRLFTDQQPMVVCYMSCVGEDKGRRESNYYGLAARAGFEFLSPERLRRVAEETARRTLVLFEAVPGPVGELPVVLGPGSSGILLHEAIGHGMEADFARKKTTIYTDRVGKRIAPEFVTIVDDGTNPNLRGSINLDDEGGTSRRTVLVEKGVLRTFMHDRISAAEMKVEPTGNGRRQSFRHMVIPRMRNTYMLAGPHDPNEIIASVKKGIYAEHFMNGEVNIGAGDYTFYIKNGYLIEDGKLGRPIKDVNIIGNGPESLERVTMVGTDFKLDDGGWTCGKRGQGVPVGLGLPTVKVSAITVGGVSQG